MPIFRIHGYPLSQLVISGGFALCFTVPYVIAGSKGTAIPLPFQILLGVMVAAALYSVLAYPFVTIEMDAGRSEVMVRWSWVFGLISRTRSIPANRIEKIVYSVTDFGGSMTLSGKRTMGYSKQSFYLSLTDGSHFYVLPQNRATRRLARKFAVELEKHLEKPVVLRMGGKGHFEERPLGK